MTETQMIVTIGMMVLGTMFTRFLPFIAFPEHKPIPKWMVVLGDRLPYASLGMLVVYALKDVNVLSAPFGLPELVSLALMTFVHRWRHDTLISIGSGVSLYLVLVNILLK